MEKEFKLIKKMKTVKGVIFSIFDPGDNFIGDIFISEDLEITDNLKYGYKIKEKKAEKEMFDKYNDFFEPLKETKDFKIKKAKIFNLYNQRKKDFGFIIVDEDFKVEDWLCDKFSIREE